MKWLLKVLIPHLELKVSKSIYRVVRSVLFTTVLLIIGLTVLTYVAVSIPAVQNSIREKAEKELSDFLGGKVEISQLELLPFNEIRLYGVSIYEPEGPRCISVGKIGAGINLWRFITSNRIEIAYAEIISLNAKIEQKTANSPLNIQFIIDAFASKEKKTPPQKFDLVLRNIVIRKSAVTFDRLYKNRNQGNDIIDFNHIDIENLRADIALPVLKNDDFVIDIRRLAFFEKSGFYVDNISMDAHITPENINVNNIKIKLSETQISISDQKLSIKGFENIKESLIDADYHAKIFISSLIPSEFSAFYPPLKSYNDKINILLEASGNKNKIDIEQFKFSDASHHADLSFGGTIRDIGSIENLSANIDRIELDFSKDFITNLLPKIEIFPEKTERILEDLGDILVNGNGSFDLKNKSAGILADIGTGLGKILSDLSITWNSQKEIKGRFDLKGEDINLNKLTALEKLGYVSANIKGDLEYVADQIGGNIVLNISYLDYNSTRIENIGIEAQKSDKDISARLIVDNNFVDVSADISCFLDGHQSKWNLDADIKKFIPTVFLTDKLKKLNLISGRIQADLKGDSPDNIEGSVLVNNLLIDGSKRIQLNEISVNAEIAERNRSYNFSSDFIDGAINGDFIPSVISELSKELVSQAIPLFVKPGIHPSCYGQYLEFNLILKNVDKLSEVLDLPLKPGVPVTISGSVDGTKNYIGFALDAPYLIQGKNKLIKNSNIRLSLLKDTPAEIRISTDMPIKNAWVRILADTHIFDNHSDLNLSWIMDSNDENKGDLLMSVDMSRKKHLMKDIDITANIKSSHFTLGNSNWKISPAKIFYSAKNLSVENLRISNGTQFLRIYGSASDKPMDILNVELSGIDLEYIFNILNINYVDFGGIATGKAYVANLFSKSPEARTSNLKVKDLAYNGCVLGDGDLEGHWDNFNKMVAINADIKGTGDSRATVNGGVYVTRDSLAFQFGADNVDVSFLHPFVEGFTSDIRGRASGDLHMYGTFSDIDLEGKAVADSVSMLVDYTNVYYSGSDTVFFNPGKISIPSMTLRDKYGHTCHLQGEVNHNFLHDASFEFKVTDLDNLLVYDTSPKMNPRWYGHVFANGSAIIRGVLGLVSLNMNLSTHENSLFTLVLDENETALNYSFLTFSDYKKEMREKIEIEESFENKFFKKIKTETRERASLFSMDLSLDVTPGATMNIIMDPKAGDKITARGRGALQFHYDTDIDKFTMYGKYILSSGNYNFSLQELILKNFIIREGSSISFNGDPLEGILDITAAYRVNANLNDLDESFKSDPDLQRTSIPVEALLKVTGEIDAPEIKFDLSLPTVTSDVERKVRSIVSTDDMMNQQIIYLLALNRFYSPEYMSSSQGGELATVASSTISSQIQNIIGSLTDKFSLAPSFKSDKDNFSDLEVDVALSSSLFDNRLLFNGNVGYRDKSTSNTTFIGDFDIEYLLSRDGRLRLKAYNHFNDASYYLKSALTTQGIGIVYRKDFNDPFSFLKKLFRRKKEEEMNKSEK